MDNDNNTNKRTEFYSDLPREVVEMLMNDNGSRPAIEKPAAESSAAEKPAAEKPVAQRPIMNAEKDLSKNIDESSTRVNNTRQRVKTPSFMGFEDTAEVDLGDKEENIRSAKEAVQKSKAELGGYVSEKKRAAASRKKDYSDIEEDPDRISKSAELEDMFGDENRGRRRGSGGAGLIIALIIFILLTGYFGYHYLLNKTDLLKSQAVVTESADLQAKYDELKLENMALQEEIGVLKGEIVLPEKPAEEAPAEATTETAPAEAPAEAAPADSQTYTVEKGDTFWKIAQKFYGNGAEFQKILDANGLTENSRINVGDTLIIPN